MIARRSHCAELLGSALAESPAAVCERERSALELLLRAHGGRVVLFGAGSAGRRARAALRSIGVEILAFADSSPVHTGSAVDGVPVLDPETAAGRFGQSALFIVTIWNAAHRFAESQARLKALRVRAVESLSAVQWRFPEAFLPFFSLDLPQKLYLERDDVIRAGDIWADEQSRSEYVGHVRWRALGDFAALPPRVAETQYFPSFFALRPDEVFIDCGAYDGDTAREFLSRNSSTESRMLLLEPSYSTYEALRAWIGTQPPATAARLVARRFAVGAREETLSFDEGAGRDAKISAAGASLVGCKTLDALREAASATYIKMDIEGSEAAALAGARQTIRRNRPVLAISVYHRQTDLWRLPLFVRDLVPDYRMFLRSHENDGWETVAYAVPPERVHPAAEPGA